MARKIFVNLLISNMKRSKAFYGRSGLQLRPAASPTSRAPAWGDQRLTFLPRCCLSRASSRPSRPRPSPTPTKSTEVLLCLSCDSRAEVDAQVAQAAGRRRQHAHRGSARTTRFHVLSTASRTSTATMWKLAYMDMSLVPEQKNRLLLRLAIDIDPTPVRQRIRRVHDHHVPWSKALFDKRFDTVASGDVYLMLLGGAVPHHVHRPAVASRKSAPTGTLSAVS